MARQAEITTVTSVAQMGDQLAQLRESNPLTLQNAILLTRLGGGVLQFAEAVFPGANSSDIYARYEEREPEGRGAHFDVYNDYLDADYPWLGVYNLAGNLSVTAAQLPDDLAHSYFQAHKKPTEVSAQARRELSAYAFTLPSTVKLVGSMEAGTGMVLSQRPTGPHIIHDLVPKSKSQPGGFIKLVKPAAGKAAKFAKDGDLMSLDQRVTSMFAEGLAFVTTLRGAPRIPPLDSDSATPASRQPSRPPRRSSRPHRGRAGRSFGDTVFD